MPTQTSCHYWPTKLRPCGKPATRTKTVVMGLKPGIPAPRWEARKITMLLCQDCWPLHDAHRREMFGQR